MSETVDRLYVLGPDGKQLCRIEDMELSATLAFQLLCKVSQGLSPGRGGSSLAYVFNKLAPDQDAKLAQFVDRLAGAALIPEGVIQHPARRRAPSGLPVALHNNLVAERKAGKVVRAIAFSDRITPPLDALFKKSIIERVGSTPIAIYGHLRINSL